MAANPWLTHAISSISSTASSPTLLQWEYTATALSAGLVDPSCRRVEIFSPILADPVNLGPPNFGKLAQPRRFNLTEITNVTIVGLLNPETVADVTPNLSGRNGRE